MDLTKGNLHLLTHVSVLSYEDPTLTQQSEGLRRSLHIEHADWHEQHHSATIEMSVLAAYICVGNASLDGMGVLCWNEFLDA